MVTQLDHHALNHATRNDLRKMVRRSVMKEIGCWSVAYQRGHYISVFGVMFKFVVNIKYIFCMRFKVQVLG